MALGRSYDEGSIGAVSIVVISCIGSGADSHSDRFGKAFGVSLCLCSGSNGSGVGCHSAAAEAGNLKDGVGGSASRGRLLSARGVDGAGAI